LFGEIRDVCFLGQPQTGPKGKGKDRERKMHPHAGGARALGRNVEKKKRKKKAKSLYVKQGGDSTFAKPMKGAERGNSSITEEKRPTTVSKF